MWRLEGGLLRRANDYFCHLDFAEHRRFSNFAQNIGRPYLLAGDVFAVIAPRSLAFREGT